MKPSAVLGALVGAALGATIWAAIAHFTGYEVGYVAWGIGLLVGGGGAALGGRGIGSGFFCAGMALLAIFGGKMAAAKYAIAGELGDPSAFFTEEMYDEMVADAEGYAAITSDDQIPAFMMEHGYTEAGDVSEITPDEIEWFKSEAAPDLVAMHAASPSFEMWRDERTAEFQSAIDGSDLAMSAVISGLGPMDLLFGLLGIVTAFKVGRGEEQSATA